VWFERSIAKVKLAARRVGLVLIGLWFVLGACSAGLVIAVFDGGRGRELRDLLDLDQRAIGPNGSSTVELTTAEADRVWELVGELFRAALPWLLLLVVVFIALAVWSVALVAQVVSATVTDSASAATGADVRADPLGAVARRAVARMPAVLGSGIVVFGLLMGSWLTVTLPVVLVAVVGGGGAAIVLTAVFAVLFVGVLTAWLWVRLTLASVIAASGGFGIGVRRSWQVSHGQFWFIAGRLLVTGLVAAAASWVVNVVTWIGPFLGFAVYIALLLLLQSVAIAVSMLVTVCGHLVTVDQGAQRS
jgi:hypothetical protein